MLVIALPDCRYVADLVRRQFPAEDVEVIVDRRRGERRRDPAVLGPEDRRSRDRRQHDIRAELRATGWAIIRRSQGLPPDPTRPWHLPWLRVQLLLRMLLGTRWEAAVRPTAGATLRDAITACRRIQREGWFN